MISWGIPSKLSPFLTHYLYLEEAWTSMQNTKETVIIYMCVCVWYSIAQSRAESTVGCGVLILLHTFYIESRVMLI